jgi:hypothetical protein
MNERKFDLHDGRTGSAITVRLMPNSSSRGIDQVLDEGMIMVRLTPARKNETLDQLLVAYLSEVLRVDSAQLEVLGASGGNDRLVTILDLDKATVQERILKQID